MVLYNRLWLHFLLLPTLATLASLGTSSHIPSKLPPQGVGTGCSLCPKCSSPDTCMPCSLASCHHCPNGSLFLRFLLTNLCKMPTHSHSIAPPRPHLSQPRAFRKLWSPSNMLHHWIIYYVYYMFPLNSMQTPGRCLCACVCECVCTLLCSQHLD